jgi:ribosomal protein S12 methylthiotransferase accessory factor
MPRSNAAATRSTPLSQQLLTRDVDASVPAWARTIGVTRVARVTGLDRCGVEVACAIRPAGQVLQVSNGKGASFADAKASALSEALELWSCENVDPSRLHWTPPEHTARFWTTEFLQPELAIRRRRAVVQPWAEAERLDTNGRVFIPASHVWCPSAGDVSVGLRDVSWTANGLGAHRDRSKALWHGLLEILEREALCRVFPNGWEPDHLRARSLRFEHPRASAIEARGVRIHCIDATPARWPIPVVAVLLADSDTRAPPLAAGYACRPTGEAAAEAAFLEACQSRLTEIHGAREDVAQSAVEIPDWLMERRRPRRHVSRLPTWGGSMSALLRKLDVAAAAVDLSRPGIPLSVVRVFVPGFRISDLLL